MIRKRGAIAREHRQIKVILTDIEAGDRRGVAKNNFPPGDQDTVPTGAAENKMRYSRIPPMTLFT